MAKKKPEHRYAVEVWTTANVLRSITVRAATPGAATEAAIGIAEKCDRWEFVSKVDGAEVYTVAEPEDLGPVEGQEDTR